MVLKASLLLLPPPPLRLPWRWGYLLLDERFADPGEDFSCFASSSRRRTWRSTVTPREASFACCFSRVLRSCLGGKNSCFIKSRVYFLQFRKKDELIS